MQVRRLQASTVSHRFDGAIMADVQDDSGSGYRVETLWQCGHGHLDFADAHKCALKRLKKLAKKS